MAIQETGVTLAPDIAAQIGALGSKTYISASSSPEQVRNGSREIGVDEIVLVDVAR